jgi:hypothetical protein
VMAFAVAIIVVALVVAVVDYLRVKDEDRE